MSFSAKLSLLSLLFTSLLVVLPASAQRITEAGHIERQTPQQQLATVAPGDTVAVVLDESSYRRVPGVVTEQNAETLHLEAPNGSNRSFNRSVIYAVIDMSAAAKAQRRKVRRALNTQPDFGQGKLLMLPTARVSEAGQGTFFSSQIFLPYLSYSFSAFPLEARAGSSVLPMTVQEFYAGLKAPLLRQRLDSDGRQFTLSAGTFGMVSSNYWTVEAKDEIGGAVFGLATYDLRAHSNEAGQRTETTAITGGAGYVATGGVFHDGPIFMGGFEHRNGGRYKFLSEAAYLPASGDVIGTAGVRYIARRVTVEGGLLTGTPLFNTSLPVVPLLTFGYRLF